MTCSINSTTTCVGATVTNCDQIEISALGEAAGPGSCKVVLDVQDNAGGSGQSSAAIAITENNEAPYWTTALSAVETQSKTSYDLTIGVAADDDLPNGAFSDPGHLSCAVANNTCGFPISVTGEGNGSVSCEIKFTTNINAEKCNIEIIVGDGYGASITERINVHVSGVVFVDADAAGNETGKSWADAFTVVQEGMNAASSGEMLWVAEGTYKRPIGGNEPVLAMKAGIKVYGGFTGIETHLSERGDPAEFPSVLDGENASYHVITGVSNSILDGFTITRGNADDGSCDQSKATCDGGGMFNDNVNNLFISNCVFQKNRSWDDGAGIMNRNARNLSITDCVFKNNSADTGGSPLGGGVYNYYSNVTIKRCQFLNNFAYSGGAGIRNYGNSTPLIENCVFKNNRARQYGAAIHNYYNAAPIIRNCLFYGNRSPFGSNYGGAIHNENGSNSSILNCTFVGNIAAYGGAIANTNSNPTITNCIIYFNKALSSGKSIYNLSSSPNVSYSNIEGGYSGNGNINIQPSLISVPLFCDVTTSNGTTSSIKVSSASSYAVANIIEIENDNIPRTVTATSGVTVTFSPTLGYSSFSDMLVSNWGTNATNLFENMHLLLGSPSIDTGNPESTYNDPDGTRNDMGTYGGPKAMFDSDYDGMEDWWEDIYSSALDKNDPSDANEDPDGDTFTNLIEFNAGTNPLDDSSHP